MKKLLLVLVLALCFGMGLWAQEAAVDPFAAIEAEELCADEMKMVQGGLPRGAGRTTMAIDGVSGGYLNQWQANLHSGYNCGDDHEDTSKRKGLTYIAVALVGGWAGGLKGVVSSVLITFFTE